MVILLLLFLVQFSVACACLALSDSQQKELFRLGWENAAPALKDRTQHLFNCCGFNVSTQDDVEPDDPFSHPLCNQVGQKQYVSESLGGPWIHLPSQLIHCCYKSLKMHKDMTKFNGHPLF